ncbi:MAG: HDOD domain-containing protein [Pseudobutyrivibrio ruminis]|jgi:HD superfamily phosphodiesterase|uniref:HD domain-containing protein n=1 Tax=Pseudobutyrivibrio ruminis TaxID=46206 RepID=UPI0026EB9523|nr:HD domain-containing protein [Pseudobutyrivibrio ruminis]MBE5913076.1 HDOD domain-containing protein [Pseudobutyrivibrio ruminis]
MYADIDVAKEILEEAYLHNPGLWREHSYSVAYAAKKIASKTAIIDESKAYSLGLLHDIGRIKGIYQLKHVIDGYNYMMEMNFDENAKICMTHSFPIKIVDAYSGKNDCSKSETEKIQLFLSNNEYDNYDYLIQLCDAIAMPSGICYLEKRLIDVAIRNGVNNYSVAKWKSFIQIKNYFDDLLNDDIYKLFNIL